MTKVFEGFFQMFPTAVFHKKSKIGNYVKDGVPEEIRLLYSFYRNPVGP